MKIDWPDWEIYKRDGCACAYCGLSGLNYFDAWRQLAIDHLIPVSREGSNTDDNKVVSCHRCNTMKGSWNTLQGEEKPSVVSREYRLQLIERVKKYLDLDGSEERKDFAQMMQELKDSSFNTAA